MKQSVLLLLLSLMLISPSVHAQSAADRLQARRLATEGQKALIEKDHDTAASRFESALGLVDAPTLVLGLARAQVGRNQLADAVRSYRRIINSGIDEDSPPAFQRALETARSELAEVEPRTPRLAIEVNGATGSTPISVTLDGKLLASNDWQTPQLVNPGSVTVRAEAPDYEPLELELEASESERLVANLNLERLEPAEPAVAKPARVKPPEQDAGGGLMEPKTQRLVGYIGIGVGAASIVTGVVTRIMASSTKSDLEDTLGPSGDPLCRTSGGDLVCSEAADQSEVDKYNTLDTTSTVTLIAGGVLAGAGLTLLLTAGDDLPEQASIQPYVGLGSLGMTGRF